MSGLLEYEIDPWVVCMRVYARVCVCVKGSIAGRGILVLVFCHCLVAEDLISFEQPSGSFYRACSHTTSIYFHFTTSNLTERSKSY